MAASGVICNSSDRIALKPKLLRNCRFCNNSYFKIALAIMFEVLFSKRMYVPARGLFQVLLPEEFGIQFSEPSSLYKFGATGSNWIALCVKSDVGNWLLSTI